jgi:hypothetical protein
MAFHRVLSIMLSACIATAAYVTDSPSSTSATPVDYNNNTVVYDSYNNTVVYDYNNTAVYNNNTAVYDSYNNTVDYDSNSTEYQGIRLQIDYDNFDDANKPTALIGIFVMLSLILVLVVFIITSLVCHCKNRQRQRRRASSIELPMINNLQN